MLTCPLHWGELALPPLNPWALVNGLKQNLFHFLKNNFVFPHCVTENSITTLSFYVSELKNDLEGVWRAKR